VTDPRDGIDLAKPRRDREFRQNSAHMLIGALRQTYGPSFAAGCADNERLKGLDRLKRAWIG